MKTVKTLLLCSLMLGALPAKAEVSHVVFVWLKDGVEQQNVEAIISKADELKAIEGVTKVVAGKAVASDRSTVDDSFDIGLTITFETVAQMQAYVTDEVHVAYVEQYIKPYAETLLVYDILDQ